MSAPEPTESVVRFTPLQRGQAGPLTYFETHPIQVPDALPVVVAIHGLGDQARHFARLFAGSQASVRLVFLQAPVAYGDGFSWFDYRRAAPAAELATALKGAAVQVHAALVELSRLYPGPTKPLLTGFSQGGMLSFAVAVEYSDSISRALPISGQLPASLWPKDGQAARRVPPIVALHGTSDSVVPIEGAQAPVAALQRLGVKAELREFAGVGHSVSPAMRQQLYQELLAFSLLGPSP